LPRRKEHSDEPLDPTLDWAAEHLRRYLASGGADGHIWHGAPTLLLTTRGRRSGWLRRTPLIYGRAGDAYIVVASRGGRPEHPSWYLNLVAEPEVTIQVLDRVMAARARTACSAEKVPLWALMTKIWPAYQAYQAQTTRDIPVVSITPYSS
jgi:deazaflavin-dependent oxidoreductase (nitroreductase family)